MSREGEALDERALESLFTRLEKPVFNVVYRWLWNVEEARDVTQEAFLKVWQARARVQVATVEPLLFRTALNLAANRRRAKRVWGWLGLEARGEEADPARGPDEDLDAARRRQVVREAVDALPAKLKDVVVLCEVSGLSYAQIAQALGIPVGTVGSRRNLALAALERRLGPLEDA